MSGTEAPFGLVSHGPAGSAATSVAVVVGDVAVDLARLGAARRQGRAPSAEAYELESAPDVSALLVGWDDHFEAIAELVAWMGEVTVDDERIAPHVTSLDRLDLRAPLPRPSKMLYSAQNYPDHVEEMRRARQAGFNAAPIDEDRDFRGDKSTSRPYLFFKAPSALCGARDDIVMPEGERPDVDWEVEMAVAIGRPAKKVRAEDALAFMAGFMTTNDISCRTLLFRPDRERLRSDWLACKSHDTFAPMGPLFVPRQFVANHLDLRLHLSVNGETRQDGNTGKLIFSPAEQIEYASHLMTLLPGDIISTGTPGGVGQGTGEFLRPGDVVEAEVEGLGRLRNRCIGQPTGNPTE